LEDSKLIPEDSDSIESSSEIEKESTKEENVKAFTEFLEKASNQESNDGKSSSDLKVENVENKKDSIFKNFLNNKKPFSILFVPKIKSKTTKIMNISGEFKPNSFIKFYILFLF